MLPEGIRAQVKKNSYPVLPIFAMIAEEGRVEEKMMYNTFNMGLGMVICVSQEDADKTVEALKSVGEQAYIVGSVIEGDKGIDIMD